MEERCRLRGRRFQERRHRSGFRRGCLHVRFRSVGHPHRTGWHRTAGHRRREAGQGTERRSGNQLRHRHRRQALRRAVHRQHLVHVLQQVQDHRGRGQGLRRHARQGQGHLPDVQFLVHQRLLRWPDPVRQVRQRREGRHGLPEGWRRHHFLPGRRGCQPELQQR